TVLIEMDKNAEIDSAFFKTLNDYQDQLHRLVENARAVLHGEEPVESPNPTPPPAAPIAEEQAEDSTDLPNSPADVEEEQPARQEHQDVAADSRAFDSPKVIP